jgi:hypothetical protein
MQDFENMRKIADKGLVHWPDDRHCNLFMAIYYERNENLLLAVAHIRKSVTTTEPEFTNHAERIIGKFLDAQKHVAA